MKINIEKLNTAFTALETALFNYDVAGQDEDDSFDISSETTAVAEYENRYRTCIRSANARLKTLKSSEMGRAQSFIPPKLATHIQ